MSLILFKNACVFDGVQSECPEGMQVLIEAEVIREVSDKPIQVSGAQVIDLGGRTLMPGLIDAHIHAYTPTFSLFDNDHMPPSLSANHAGAILSAEGLRLYGTRVGLIVACGWHWSSGSSRGPGSSTRERPFRKPVDMETCVHWIM